VHHCKTVNPIKGYLHVLKSNETIIVYKSCIFAVHSPTKKVNYHNIKIQQKRNEIVKTYEARMTHRHCWIFKKII